MSYETGTALRSRFSLSSHEARTRRDCRESYDSSVAVDVAFVDVAFLDGAGRVLTRVSASDDGTLRRAIGHALDFPVISGIDPYGETVFDGSQIVELLAEWDHLLEEATSRSEEALGA